MFQLFSDCPRRHCSLSSTLTFQFLSLPLHLSLIFFPLLVSAKKVVSQPWACRFCYWILFLPGKWEVFLGIPITEDLQSILLEKCLRGLHVVKLTTGLANAIASACPKLWQAIKLTLFALCPLFWASSRPDFVGKGFNENSMMVIRNTF